MPEPGNLWESCGGNPEKGILRRESCGGNPEVEILKPAPETDAGLPSPYVASTAFEGL
jgi:hypothetical protein